MAKKNTIVVIGNGFDRWQNLNTSYRDLKQYYLAHRKQILKKLKIKPIKMTNSDGSSYETTDVELIYGDPFDPEDLDDEFWFEFENPMAQLDAERINLFFGKGKKELKEMAKSAANAKRILIETFCSWIKSIDICKEEPKYHFKDSCVFINFNYTDTLEKRFSVPKQDVIHIHGEADDPGSIIVGHSAHPQKPVDELYRMGGRFRGLFIIESILYQTDKHVGDNIQTLGMWLGMAGIRPEAIKDIYVLGHSFGLADIEYFMFLKNQTCLLDAESREIEFPKYEDVEDPLEDLHRRIQYVIKRYGNDNSITEPILPEEEEAVYTKYLSEQWERDTDRELEYLKKHRRSFRKRHFGSKSMSSSYGEENSEPDVRTQDASWHITYFSEADKERIERVMRALECKNYELFSSIDEAMDALE